MTNQSMCPVCEQGSLQFLVEKREVCYGGQKGMIDSLFSVCDSCGSELADADQVRQNKRAMIAFKKQVDGLLSGAEVKALRTRYGITQQQAAQIFGGTR